MFTAGTKVAPMPDGTLLIAGRRYVETDEHLFRELYGERRVAFQQDESGNITGMVRDGSSVAQSFKVPAYDTIGVAGPLLGFCFLGFLGVLLRRFYQHTLIKQWVEYRKNKRPNGSRSSRLSC